MMICLLVSFLASLAGSICGIGGGVVIKPVLDFLQVAPVSTIGFLSSCTVLAMSCYSVGKMVVSGDAALKSRTITTLALGSVVGGVLGKQLFSELCGLLGENAMVSGLQAACLGVLTIGTFLYTVFKQRIKTHRVTNPLVAALIGMVLGMFSSFLGIGGGPINLIVLGYFFSQDSKTAAASSLYIIFFSQVSSLITSVVSRTVPDFSVPTLVLMILGGILGGIAGRSICKKIAEKTVDRLFLVLNVLIIGICIVNFCQAIL